MIYRNSISRVLFVDLKCPKKNRPQKDIFKAKCDCYFVVNVVQYKCTKNIIKNLKERD